MFERNILNNIHYDGILRKPFLVEHWYKGFAAGLALWLPCFMTFAGIDFIPQNFAAFAATFVSCAVFAVAATYHEGFAVNLTSNNYRLYTWVAGLKFGTWQVLPTIAAITVRPYIKNYFLPLTETQNEALDTGFTATEKGWQVLLHVSGKPIGITAAITTRDKSEVIATRLAEMLKVPLNFTR